MNNKKAGYIFVALASFFFAIIAIIGKTALSTGISVYDLVILQYFATVLILFVYFIFKGLERLKLNKHHFLLVVIQGIFGSAATTIFFYKSLEHINAGIASMLIFTHPVLVSLFFMVTKLKKINFINNTALIFAFMGSAMVINIFAIDVRVTPVIGLAFGLLSSLCYAFYNIFADLKLRKLDTPAIIFYTSLMTMFVALMLNPAFFKFSFSLDAKLMFYVLELSVISGILPVIFIYKGISYIGAEKASIVATAELPLTILMAYIFLSEKMGLIQIVGVVLIIASIIILQNEEKIAGSKIFRKADVDAT